MKYPLLSLLLVISFSTFGQTSATDPVDVLGWYGTSITFDLKKKWELGIDYQARFQNNLASYKGSYISFPDQKWFTRESEYRQNTD
jgi:hypothetical protein